MVMGQLCQEFAAPQVSTHHPRGHGPSMGNVSSQPTPTTALRAAHWGHVTKVMEQAVCQSDGGHQPRAQAGLPFQCFCKLLSQTLLLRSPGALQLRNQIRGLTHL